MEIKDGARKGGALDFVISQAESRTHGHLFPPDGKLLDRDRSFEGEDRDELGVEIVEFGVLHFLSLKQNTGRRFCT